MARACIFSLSLIFLLFACTQQLGVLYVNHIIGNSDFANVLIEQSIINDNSLRTTNIIGRVDCSYPRTPCGVYVEQVNYFDGNVEVPVNLEVFLNTTIEGMFFPNGGIVSDANVHGSILPGVTSYPYAGYSFIVEDNTGNTGMTGELRLYGGLDADSGAFTVADETGETRIPNGLFKPNGGINVQDGQFTVAKEDGTFFTESFANVVGDFYLGTSKSEDRYITRFPASSSYGGDTYLLGQSVSEGTNNIGGDIILEPGVGQDRKIGAIILGRQANDNLYFGRPAVDISGTSGDDTTFQGQDSSFGDGGDILLSAGDATSSGNGGNIILDVGYSQTGIHGEIIIGNVDHPYYSIMLYRPPVEFTSGGATYISGQSTNAGEAGDLYLRAAGVVDFSNAEEQAININEILNLKGTPGDVYLAGGDSPDVTQGDIILGRSTPVDLIVKRYPIDSNIGANTFIHAVDRLTNTNGNAGDLYLQAGDAGNGGDGGDVRLSIGDIVPSSNLIDTFIYWGIEEETKNSGHTVRRTISRGAGGSTNIIGQESVTSIGGTLHFEAGTGGAAGKGGSLTLNAGIGTIGDGGSISLTGGDGNQNGGLVSFIASTTTGGVPGNILLQTGSTTTSGGGLAGNFYLNAGSGSTLGDIQILNAAELRLTAVNILLFDILKLEAASTGDNIVFAANPESVLSYNGETLLKDRIFSVQQVPGNTLTAPTPPDPLDFNLDIVQQMQYLQDTVQNLVSVLSQCGHGLFNVQEGSNFGCVLPGSVPTPISYPIATSY